MPHQYSRINDTKTTKQELGDLMRYNSKSLEQSRLKAAWEEKALHGQFPRKMATIKNNKNQSLMWLKKGAFKPEVEALLAAVQDEALRTKNFEK